MNLTPSPPTPNCLVSLVLEAQWLNVAVPNIQGMEIQGPGDPRNIQTERGHWLFFMSEKKAFNFWLIVSLRTWVQLHWIQHAPSQHLPGDFLSFGSRWGRPKGRGNEWAFQGKTGKKQFSRRAQNLTWANCFCRHQALKGQDTWQMSMEVRVEPIALYSGRNGDPGSVVGKACLWVRQRKCPKKISFIFTFCLWFHSS